MVEDLEREAGEALQAKEKELAIAQRKLAAQVNTTFARLEKQLDAKVGPVPAHARLWLPRTGWQGPVHPHASSRVPVPQAPAVDIRIAPALPRAAQLSSAMLLCHPSQLRCTKSTAPPWPSSSSSTRCGRSIASCTTEWLPPLRCGALQGAEVTCGR